MAVFKNDPSITYVKEFNVFSDNRQQDLINYVYNNVTYSYENKTHIIELSDSNSYYPQNTLYNFSIMHDEVNGSVSSWGTVTVNDIGVIVIRSKIKIKF